MARNKTLALILAGGKGSRLEVLTEERAKPAMPFAGMYRLIDFALSNCMHSGLSDVWVIEQYHLHSLNEHLANGRPWDLDRTYGGLQVLPPFESQDEDDGEGGFAEGNADAIYRHRDFIREFDPDILVVLSADHVYKLDYSKVIDQHLERKADVTMVTKQIPREEAARFGNVRVDEQGRITGFVYKPESPQSDLVTTEVFVYHARTLLETLDQLAADNMNKDNSGKGKSSTGKSEGEATALRDFGHELIPKLVRDGRAFEYRLEGYWQDVGTVESYWQAHMDLLTAQTELPLDDPNWPILTYGSQRLPARVHGSARIEDSLISPGCTIRGDVIRSVLAPGVMVEQDAVVRDSVVLHNTVIEARAVVDYAIVDTEVRIGEGAMVGQQRSPVDNLLRITSSEIAMIGQRARISAGARLPADARIKPSTTVEATLSQTT